MKVRIQMVFEAEDGRPEMVEEVAQLQRGPLRSSELGVSLAEAKTLLHGMQQAMVAEQVDQYLGQFKTCTLCGAARTRKGQHTVVYRTLFGKLNLHSPRLYDCPCQSRGRRSSSPLSELLTSHCAPELSYLQTKFASLMSYGLSVDLLSDVLPLANEINHSSIRRQVHTVANVSKENWVRSSCSSSKVAPMTGRSCHRQGHHSSSVWTGGRSSRVRAGSDPPQLLALGPEPQDLVCRDGPTEPLQVEVAHGSGVDCFLNGSKDVLADQDLTRRGAVAQPSGEVDH